MTNESTDSQPASGAPDPLRSLDGLTPPDQWDAIVDRASSPAVHAPMVGKSHRLRPLLAAAVVVALAGVAGGLVLADRDNDRLRVSSTPGTGVEAVDPPADALGRLWYLRRFFSKGREVSVPELSGKPGYGLDLRWPGRVSFAACNGAGGSGVVSGDRLVAEGRWFTTLMGCIGPNGDAEMALDEGMFQFLQDNPTIEVRGDELTLRAGDDVAEWVSVPTSLPAGVVMQHAGESLCRLGLRPRPAGAVPSDGLLTPGAASPPLLAPADAPIGNGVSPGTWHLAAGDLVVEIHVPGSTDDDPAGDGPEMATLNRGQAEVWLTDKWVQVKSFPGTDPAGPCDWFDVTVAGSTEDARRAVALEVAERVVTGLRPQDSATSSSVLDQTTSVTPPNGSAATVPRTSEPVTSRPINRPGFCCYEPASIQRRWLLNAVLVDGAEVAVEDVTNGGPDSRGGPPMIDATDPRSVKLRGCHIVPLSLVVSGSEAMLSLGGPGQESFAGCPGAAGTQHGQILKALSVGNPVSLGSDGEGRNLEIRTEDVTLVFREA
ncbi:MAG: META domain-containing protein [Aquihabitans sp.]